MPTIRSWRSIVLTLLLLSAASVESPVFAQIAPSEYDLKAAFVYQFLSYITWPESKAVSDGVILIGVLGAPELVGNLSTLARQQLESARAIEIRALPPDADPRELHILYVAAGFDAAAAGLLQSAAENGVLTITESLPRPPNSVINFEIIDSKVRFDVALALARSNGLDISGRLLQVALRVME